MKTKLVKPVLVDSEIANIYKCRTGGLGYKEVATSYTVEGQGQQLILISLDPDEKIEEGDSWIGHKIGEIEEESKLILITPENRKSILHHVVKSNFGKVIATQDKISPEYIQQFIEEYNKGEVKDVEIEMEELYFHGSGYYKSEELSQTEREGHILMREFKPKLTNGFVTIIEKSNIEKQADLVEEIAFENLKVKEPIIYTEEEVKQLFIDRAKEFSPASKVFGDFLLKQDLNWFEQNKKK